MKRFLTSLITLLVLVVAASLIYNRFADLNLETEVTIEAPSSQVWEVLLDHESYPDWNPFITQIGGSTAVGEQLQLSLQPEGQKEMSFAPEVLVNEEGKEFRWKGKLGVQGIFDGEHYFLLEPLEEERTKLIQGENFSGVFAGALTAWLGKSTEAGFNSMNQALKERAEQAWLKHKAASEAVTDSIP